MTKIVAKVYLRMMVMIALAHITGGLVLTGNYWGAVTSGLAGTYQMLNILIFLSDDPIRFTRKMKVAIVRLGVLVTLSLTTGYLFGVFLTGSVILGCIGLFLTGSTVRFVYRNDPTSQW